MRNEGQHFLQIPGPTNIPDRIRRKISLPTIDHRGPDFRDMAAEILARLKVVFGTEQPVVIFPSSGTGAWEAALVNALSPGDRILMCDTGHFASLWRDLALAIGLRPSLVEGDWRMGPDPEMIARCLRDDRAHSIKAVCLVHNETSTGCVADVAAVRRALDESRHPALLIVDTISSLASIEYRHDEWGVDITICGSQKGLMLPPGLGFNAVSKKALHAAKVATSPRSYWAWKAILSANEKALFPYTPSTNLLFGLLEALRMIEAEGLENVLQRHSRLAEATRHAVAAWGLEVYCRNPNAHSASLTTVIMPYGTSADEFRRYLLDTFDVSLGNGLAKLSDTVFRIGHLGHFNYTMLMGVLATIEIGLSHCQILHRSGGVQAALDYLTAPAPVGTATRQ